MKPIYIILTLALFIRLAFGSLFPVTQDEAYYFIWSRALDFGYFDHPPFIAWLVSLGNFNPGNVFSFRVLGILTSLLVPIIFISILKKTGINHRKAIISGLCLTCFNLGALVFGFLQTPDLPLIVFWSLALHEAMAALKGDEKRWLSAGVFTGLGFLSKYTMVIIGLVFLYGLIKKKDALKSPWPYLGGLCFALVITPHLLWNHNHDWVSIRFQLGRGFLSQYHVDTKNANKLPPAIDAAPQSQEVKLADYFKELLEPEKPKKPRSNVTRGIERLIEFVSSQLALWGAFLVVIATSFWRRRNNLSTDSKLTWAPHTKAITKAACFVPLFIFGLISPFQKIEANWPAAYMIAAAVILIHKINLSKKQLYTASIINIMLVSLLVIHSKFPFVHQGISGDRVLKETYGYEALSAKLSQLDAPVFADTYQNTSLLAFYDPEGVYMQWPGITRMSELIRRKELVHFNFSELKRVGRFYILTNNFYPPQINNFSSRRLWKIFSCIDGKLDIIEAYGPRPAIDHCPLKVQVWTLTEYALTNT